MALWEKESTAKPDDPSLGPYDGRRELVPASSHMSSTRAPWQACACIPTFTHIYSCMRTHTYAQIHTYTHTHALTHTLVCAYTHIYTHTYTHIYLCVHTHTYTHALTHT